MLGLVAVGLSAGLLFSLVFTVLVELLPSRSASLVAVDSLGENIFAAVGSVTIVAIGAVANVLIVVLMKRYGQRWREKLA